MKDKIKTAKKYFNEKDYDLKEVASYLYTEAEMIKKIKQEFSECFKTSNIDEIEIYWKYFDSEKYIKENKNIEQIEKYYFYL